MSKSFLAFMIKPAPDLAGEFGRIRRSFGIEASYTEDRFHATLAPLGWRRDIRGAALDMALAAAGAIRHPPFRAVFDRVEAGVLCGTGTIDGIVRFQRALVTALAGAGMTGLRRKRFDPHVTLSYRDRSSGSHDIDGVSWMVEDFLLIESLQGEGCHVPLGRWPLRAT